MNRRIAFLLGSSHLRVNEISGPKRYDYVPSHRGWIYSRDGMSMQDLLRTELAIILARDVVIDLDEGDN